MYKVKIFGAGSSGNHYAHACRTKGWEIVLCDIDPEALKRTRKEIYPERYGRWDESIRLINSNEDMESNYDIVILCTPPDTHIKLAKGILTGYSSKVLLIEKPLTTPKLVGCEELLGLAKKKDTFVGVAYNQVMTEKTSASDEILQNGILGKPLTITSVYREHWRTMNAAHPWLLKPGDYYLGFMERGGGVCNEHSHAISIWQHFSHIINMGRIIEVSAMLDFVNEGRAHYDVISQINVKTEKDLIGTIAQDIVSDPPKKLLWIQGAQGYFEWHADWSETKDALRYSDEQNNVQEMFFDKNRFGGIIDHAEDVLKGKVKESPISLEKGLETMMVVAAAHISHKLGRTVRIDYDEGYNLNAIK